MDDNNLPTTLDWSGREILSFQAVEANLVGINAERSTIRNTEFKKCNLSEGNFRRTTCTEVIFENCIMRNFVFSYGNFRESYFRGSDLSNGEAIGANFVGSDFTDANLEGFRAEGSSFDNARFIKASLQGAELKGLSFEHAIFKDANLEDLDLANVNLRYSKIINCKTKGLIISSEEWSHILGLSSEEIEKNISIVDDGEAAPDILLKKLLEEKEKEKDYFAICNIYVLLRKYEEGSQKILDFLKENIRSKKFESALNIFKLFIFYYDDLYEYLNLEECLRTLSKEFTYNLPPLSETERVRAANCWFRMQLQWFESQNYRKIKTKQFEQALVPIKIKEPTDNIKLKFSQERLRVREFYKTLEWFEEKYEDIQTQMSEMHPDITYSPPTITEIREGSWEVSISGNPAALLALFTIVYKLIIEKPPPIIVLQDQKIESISAKNSALSLQSPSIKHEINEMSDQWIDKGSIGKELESGVLSALDKISLFIGSRILDEINLRRSKR
jgi:uncharacterized protein YjbI with pentapeptide repeats